MRNKIVFVFAVAFAIILGIFVANIPQKTIVSQELTQIPKYSKEETDSSQPKYILKDYKGKLALYLGTKKSPEIIFDVYTNNLPDIDKYKLQEGIAAADYDELMRLIEDYTS